MNKVFLVGRLTRDPELRYTSSNLASMRCAIAVDRAYQREGEERGADFINIVAFGNRAETIQKFFKKGNQIAIDGHINTGSYDDADGKKVYTTDVIIDNFQFIDPKGTRPVSDDSSLTPDDFPTSDDTTSSDSSDPFADFGAKIEVSDSELPF